MKKFLLTLLAALLCGTAAGSTGPAPVLRLHVVANSDSEADQNVKYAVRDAVTEYVTNNGTLNDYEEAMAYAQAHLQDIERVANRVLQENGMPYGATAELGVFPFPDRTYGGILFPQGEYHAVRVRLGDSRGQNWWFVLFPPLCFIETVEPNAAVAQEDEVQYTSFLWELLH